LKSDDTFKAFVKEQNEAASKKLSEIQTKNKEQLKTAESNLADLDKADDKKNFVKNQADLAFAEAQKKNPKLTREEW